MKQYWGWIFGAVFCLVFGIKLGLAGKLFFEWESWTLDTSIRTLTLLVVIAGVCIALLKLHSDSKWQTSEAYLTRALDLYGVPGMSPEPQKTIMLDRWKKGDSLNTIARLFETSHAAISRVVYENGGVRTQQRKRSSGALSLTR